MYKCEFCREEVDDEKGLWWAMGPFTPSYGKFDFCSLGCLVAWAMRIIEAKKEDERLRAMCEGEGNAPTTKVEYALYVGTMERKRSR